jgi:hypothetical protein
MLKTVTEPIRTVAHFSLSFSLKAFSSLSTSLGNILYILESNPHSFYSCRGLKMQMRIRIDCGLDSRSRAGVWPHDRAGVRAVRTIQGGKNEVQIRFENMRYFGCVC